MNELKEIAKYLITKIDQYYKTKTPFWSKSQPKDVELKSREDQATEQKQFINN